MLAGVGVDILGAGEDFGKCSEGFCYLLILACWLSTTTWVFTDLHFSLSSREGAALTTLQMIGHSRNTAGISWAID